MLRTPLKNSKNVDKPFKSPFDSSAQGSNERIKINNRSLKRDSQTISSPLSSRSLEAKRVLLLDNDKKEIKRQKIIKNEIEKIHTEVSQNVTRNDLLILKRKIFEIRQELDCLKSRKQCAKKHNPEELRNSIDKWRSVCQNALETICSELTEQNGQSSKISDILNMLNIPETIVHYSEKDDAFI